MAGTLYHKHPNHTEETKLSDTTILTTIISSTALTSTISSLFLVFSNRRKDCIENITKERKTWRDELRVIGSEISKCQNETALQRAINKLKVRINPRGIVSNSESDDCHIWKQIHAFEEYISEIYKTETDRTKIDTEVERYKNIFIGLISCLLKYDWERSKREINDNIQTLFVVLSLSASFVLYTLRYYCDTVMGGKYIDYISYCAIFYLISCLSVLVIILSKYKNKDLLLLCGVMVMAWFLWGVSAKQIANIDCINQIIFSVPLMILFYVVFIRIHDVQEDDAIYTKTIKSFLKHFPKPPKATDSQS